MDVATENTKNVNEKPRYWLVVHDQSAYEENCRLLGFNKHVYNAKNVKPGDLIVYYWAGYSLIKGIYEVSEKPWVKDPRWLSDYQIGIEPIMELENGIDIRTLVSELGLFTNKERWYSHIQGTNAIRELSIEDYNVIEHKIVQSLVENNEDLYFNLKEDDICLLNETIEQKISRIKRYQQITNRLKTKYNNRCQIEKG